MAVESTNYTVLESCHFYEVVWVSSDFNQGKGDEGVQDVDPAGLFYHVWDRNVAEHCSGS